VDGVSEDSAPYADDSGKETPAYIGRGHGYAEDAYFGGRIDDVRVYNYAMGAAEIWDLVLADSSRFRICNSSDETLAWFDDSGYALVKGAIHEQQSSLSPSEQSDDFIVYDDGVTPEVIAYINDSGDLYLKGGLYQYAE